MYDIENLLRLCVHTHDSTECEIRVFGPSAQLKDCGVMYGLNLNRIDTFEDPLSSRPDGLRVQEHWRGLQIPRQW